MKASVYIATSLDGFIARKNGGLDWLPGADGAEAEGAEDYGYHAFMDSVDHIVMGRNTFNLVLSFGDWPYEKPVTVLSHSLDALPDCVDLQNCSPADLIKVLEQRGRKSLYIDGGKTIQGFLSAGLMDEITITRVPIILGEGIPLFGPVEKDIKLLHLETTSFPNGFVQSRYQVL